MMKFARGLRERIRNAWVHIAIVLTLSFMCHGFIQAVSKSTAGLGSAEAASWVQAITSFMAILAAVLIATHQTKAAENQRRAVEAAEVQALLDMLQVEMAANFAALSAHAGPMLEANAEGGAFCGEYPVPDNAGPIFTALIPKIGAVQPAELRRQIVRAASGCEALVIQFKYNNKLVNQWRALRQTAQRTDNVLDHQDVAEAFAALRMFGVGMSEQWLVVKSEMTAALEALSSRRIEHSQSSDSENSLG